MNCEEKQKVALFRFSLIAPIINNTFAEATEKEYMETVCSKKFNVPVLGEKDYAPATIKDWLYYYRKKGFDGLFPKSRCDVGQSRCLPSSAKEFIISSKQQNPTRSAKSIYAAMLANGIIKPDDASLASITRFIQKNNLKRKQLEPVDRKAFELEFPNDCWQADTSVGPYLNIDGRKKKTYLIMFLDDCSRLIPHGEFFFDENLINLEKVFKKAVAKRGIPKKLFVDNGAVYQSDQLQMICASLGTVISYTKAYSPESKGKIERSFRTIKDKWMYLLDWNKISTLDELNQMFSNFIEHEYNNQTHSSIGMKPMERYMQHIDSIKFIKSVSELDNIFLHRVTRKVNNDSTVSLDKNIFEVPCQYMGKRINVRFHAASMDKAYIFDDKNNLLHTIFPVNKVDNSKVKRNTAINFHNLNKDVVKDV